MSSSLSVLSLAIRHVKVTFKDETGEGSGVARSFYSSIVEVSLIEDFIIIGLFGYEILTRAKKFETKIL
jgi:hypothetical protein